MVHRVGVESLVLVVLIRSTHTISRSIEREEGHDV